MPLMQRDGVYYADFRRRGGGLISCRTRDLVKAEQEYARLTLAIAEGKVVTGMAVGATLGQAFDRADRLVFSGLKSHKTIGFHRKAIAAVIPEATVLSDLTIEHAEELLIALKGKGNGLSTINRVMQTLGRVLAMAKKWHMMDQTVELPHFPEPPGRLREIQYAEEEMIREDFMRTGKPEMAYLTTFLVETGIRLGEYLAVANHRYHKERKTFEMWKTKSADRTIPLTPPAIKSLEYLRALPHPLTKNQIEARWQAMRRNIGMDHDKEFVVHALRHTCCTRLFRTGGKDLTPAHIMRWMGHKDLKTTLRYTHLNDTDLTIGADALAAAREKADA